jgi:hypothetical protein
MTLRKAALLLLILSLGTCNQALMLAPPGSSFAGGLIANPPFIAANGDVSVISGLLMDGTGNPVPDGTVVQFFTNLGRIDEQGKTNDGVVRVNLISDSRSGTATVTAVSGGEGSTSPTTTTTTLPTGSGGGGGLSAFSVTGATAITASMVSATVEVKIGSSRPAHVILTADPPRITTGRSTTLLAQVFGDDGNPVANVPVIFQIVTGTNVQARLDSGGRAVFTDNDGRATDVLRTNSTVAGEIHVVATTANDIASNELVVPVFISP